MKSKILVLILVLPIFQMFAAPPKQISITVENNSPGAPITLGIPFPINELYSVDQVRLLNGKGVEIPCQTTEVATWHPADSSVKWIWVFFFAEHTSDYILEYGDGVQPIQSELRITSANNMRARGGIEVNTGPLTFYINKNGNGFLDEVFLDGNVDGQFTDNEKIASTSTDNRGTFMDLMDDSGIDMSKAVINEVFREKGSGPLHIIFRIEGTYTYNRPDNNLSPFVMRIHAYAGKSFIKVLHTITYTGVPDKHQISKGQHANIATHKDTIISEETAKDPGWTQPNDKISGTGLTFKYHLDKEVQYTTALSDGKWYSPVTSETESSISGVIEKQVSVLQNGPNRNELNSSSTKRIENFTALVTVDGKLEKEKQRAKGWIDISDKSRGISMGIKNFLEEYPKELAIDANSTSITGYIWPEDVDPMSFARKHTERDGGMLDNFAQGITKTTEFIYYFHNDENIDEIKRVMEYSLAPPIAHADPSWYSQSKVYGNLAPLSKKYMEYENALQYKYDWWAFNQKWEPWYGMFDYGDGKTYYFDDEWIMWNNNEPTVDFMLWTNFMRTGDVKSYTMAQAVSKHTMDVDNIHWPKKRTYVGANNDAIDFLNYQVEPESTPYLGMGRRHGEEHWYALLSAHIWIQGWIASYYLTADHRALEVAKMTGDFYLKRIWGEHDLRGRRLYLSILNLVELYDATKLDKYKKELDYRVSLLLELQEEQGGNLILDRYGYSQTYVAQGLYKYYQLTNKEEIKKAMIDHARWVRDVPPLNHQMESYLATIYPLLIGYEFTGNSTYFDEALKRAEFLKVSELKVPELGFANQADYNKELIKVSNLPKDKNQHTIWETNQGLRVFGWTHAYNIPYLLYWLDNPIKKTINNGRNTAQEQD